MFSISWFVSNAFFIAEKARKISIFINIAVWLDNTLDNMATPNSVKQKGIYLKPIFSGELEVTICDLQFLNSSTDI